MVKISTAAANHRRNPGGSNYFVVTPGADKALFWICATTICVGIWLLVGGKYDFFQMKIMQINFTSREWWIFQI